MTSRLKRIGRLGCPAVLIGVFALLSAGISGAHSVPASKPGGAALERHFQHEDTLYAAHPYRTPASTPQRVSVPLYTPAMLAAHFNREDLLYHPRAVSTPQRVSVPLYTPAMLAAHFNREDLLYQPRPSLAANPSTIVTKGFDWTDWAIGLGSGIVLILALGAVLAVVLQRRHRLQAA